MFWFSCIYFWGSIRGVVVADGNFSVVDGLLLEGTGTDAEGDVSTSIEDDWSLAFLMFKAMIFALIIRSRCFRYITYSHLEKVHASVDQLLLVNFVVDVC